MHFASGIKTPFQLHPIQHTACSKVQRTECLQLVSKLFPLCLCNFDLDKIINPFIQLSLLLLSQHTEREKATYKASKGKKKKRITRSNVKICTWLTKSIYKLQMLWWSSEQLLSCILNFLNSSYSYLKKNSSYVAVLLFISDRNFQSKSANEDSLCLENYLYIYKKTKMILLHSITKAQEQRCRCH